MNKWIDDKDYYEKLRCIVQSTPDGSDERVYFTEELDEPIEDLTVPGFEVSRDVILEGVELPSGFPLDYDLARR
jgi:hypothetical protein